MRVLILTQYYPPETGAPQNRLSSLAVYLKKRGDHVEILTALPNYPKYQIFPRYKGRLHFKETIDGITVHRSYIFVSKKKGLLPRLINYFSFTVSAYFSACKRLQKFDLIICESPPLFLGITAVLLKRKWNSKLIFNVSDLWPESVEKLGIIKNKWLINRSYALANWIYKNADLISGQTKGIIDAISAMQPQQRSFWFPNGADLDKFPDHLPAIVPSKKTFDILYAGIIGHAQGLEVILHAANILREKKDIHFYIIGDGPVKEDLRSIQNKLELSNVTFAPDQPRQTLLEQINKCCAYIVPLKKIDLFKGAIPSKLFEPLALGKPILLGVEGEARTLFIDEGNGGLFYEPENAIALSIAILRLYNDPKLTKTLGENGRKYVTTFFNRAHILKQFYEEILKLFP